MKLLWSRLWLSRCHKSQRFRTTDTHVHACISFKLFILKYKFFIFNYLFKSITELYIPKLKIKFFKIKDKIRIFKYMKVQNEITRVQEELTLSMTSWALYPFYNFGLSSLLLSGQGLIWNRFSHMINQGE